MKALRFSLNERILVPVDFSACSRRALDYALALAQPRSTKLVLLHVVELYPLDYVFGLKTDPEQCQRLVAQAQSKLDRLERQCATAEGPAVETLVRLGKPFKEILKAAREYAVQLVVMGTHGYTGLQRIEFGSTAEHVIRLAPCPVLVVRDQEREFVWEDKADAGPLSEPEISCSV